MKNRYKSFDTLRGICIITVVLCHTLHFEMIYPHVFSRWLQIIFLNSFYFTAGWIYSFQSVEKNVSVRKKVFSKCVQLGFPYVMLCALFTIYDGILSCVFNNKFISDTYEGSQIVLRDVFCFLSLNGVGTLWFLPVLLIAMLTLILFDNIVSKRSLQLILATTISVGSYLILLWLCNVTIEPNNMILNIISKELFFLQRIFVAISYIFLGYFLQRIEKKYIYSGARKIVLGGIFLLLWIIDYYSYGIFESFAVIGTTILLLGIEQKTESRYELKFLEYCGKNSLLIMVLHYNLLLPVIMQVSYSFSYMSQLPIIVQRGIIFALDFLLTLLIVEVVNKSEKIAFLFGKGQMFAKVKKLIVGA